MGRIANRRKRFTIETASTASATVLITFSARDCGHNALHYQVFDARGGVVVSSAVQRSGAGEDHGVLTMAFVVEVNRGDP